ncbi:MAG: signal peptidase II [Chloroflexi bacterium]|nr:signal peptidase II [Chloroflexota bacterium]
MKVVYRLLPALLIALTLDWATKMWAEQTLVLDQPVSVIGQVFRLTLGYNTGLGFGLFASNGPGPVALTGVVIFGLAAWIVNALRTGDLSPSAGWPIGLLFGGAIANFADRLPDGRVTDFLDVGLGATRWPTFNLADSLIVLGVSLLMVTIIRAKPKETSQ